MPKKKDNYEFDIIGMAMLMVVLTLVGFHLYQTYHPEPPNSRFEALCFEPDTISNINCSELKQIVWACPDAYIKWKEMNCSVQNLTMREYNDGN